MKIPAISINRHDGDFLSKGMLNSSFRVLRAYYSILNSMNFLKQ